MAAGLRAAVLHEVELMAPADQIPEELVFDLTGLDIGDTIRVGDLTLPAGISATAGAEAVVATVAGTSAQASEDATEDDAAAAAVPEVTLVVQVAGKVRDRLTIPVGTSEEKALEAALASDRVRAAFDGRRPSKVVYVPDRLINLVP